MLRLYRALGDPSRLRILRLLTDRDLYLTEIAQQMELSKPTVKHHLAALRAAGLVTVTDEGNMTYYSLRRARVAEAGPELLPLPALDPPEPTRPIANEHELDR